MTPPEVLLERALKQARQLIAVRHACTDPPNTHVRHTCMLTQEMGVVRKQEEEVAGTLDLCIRCVALSRIVHGDSHWVLAKAHIQLGKAYWELKGKLHVAIFMTRHHAWLLFRSLSAGSEPCC